ncbi:NanoRNase/pAp phosphatase [Posidoniimonas corsicana]|uniref:NanoRNase/pAp phosphatase n=1 Tax=Posidoniimonas corsicana TaxID=1938618 RepID=A0A5C5UXA4_9BACT|nr:bifunctional oligoribonuclease/PAP phosphatase NrnA [Posidoniimonas corsicana]TWT30263.1 NanoRNase/pAp phosphatase [Posidoniimonas corsicana]
MPIDWNPLLPIVEQAETFVLTSHMRPDCDALGSELGMAAALQALGKRVRIINGDSVPSHIAFIDAGGMIEVFGSGVTQQEVHEADVHMVLDTSAWGQLGPMADVIRSSPARKVVIDHHVSGDDLGAMVLKDVTSESNGRLVLQAIEALGVELTAEMARPLFYAMATDTGWFRFSSVTEQTLLAAAKLVAAGASPSDSFSTLYDRNTLSRVRLHGRIMESTALVLDGRVGVARATEADFAATGAEAADTEDVVNRVLSIAGVEVAALFVELGEGANKVSLRSRSDFDVREIAEQFGGGGHTKAAGVRIRGPIDEAQRKVLEAIQAKIG